MSARAVGGAEAGGDEDRGRAGAGGHVGGVPDARRVDGIVVRGEGDGLRGAVGMFLVKGEGAGGADHQLGAVRVHLPGVPALVEAILRDEPALDPIGFVAGGVGGVPFGAGELEFNGRGGVEAEMGGVGGEAGHINGSAVCSAYINV